MRSVQYLAGLSSLCLLVTACQPIQGDSLLTDRKEDSSAHTVSKEPKSEELMLQMSNPNVNMTSTDTKAELTGECYVSTYPSHSIIVLNGPTPLPVTDLNSNTPAGSGYGTCRNGRFNILLNITSLGSPAVHSLRLYLQARDADGNVVINEARGAPIFNLSK
ncbi:hypothetical protein EZJ49_10785 [Bdellovibrio bacteriovorus]|uniref:hypothetical protein n=1 Tax=Bdellovibrio bacteriovorus TaxID=959 RepID=UPI0021D2CEE7|nr:hypothetical protein [Bdellovibrio bacteriovorus]UXR63560.1 hypothetical protein EZJ49_10785 [Bdellovibrio bacteriovorus]